MSSHVLQDLIHVSCTRVQMGFQSTSPHVVSSLCFYWHIANIFHSSHLYVVSNELLLFPWETIFSAIDLSRSYSKLLKKDRIQIFALELFTVDFFTRKENRVLQMKSWFWLSVVLYWIYVIKLVYSEFTASCCEILLGL